MKKVLAIAFVAGLVLASCAKKEEVTETNTMMEEPEITTAAPAPMKDSTAAVAPKAVDSAMAK